MVAAFLVLGGCSMVTVEPEPGVPRGVLATRPGRAGCVVAAPHGTSDAFTDQIAAEIAQRTGFGLVVASGFSLEPDTPQHPGRRYQVNRPTEGIPGRSPREETESPEARRVYLEFERRVREVARAPLALYVEIHGNGRRETAGQLEIATVGLDALDAWRIRTLLELVRDARVRAHPGAPRLAVRVEPIDPIRYTASGAKQTGILRQAERALHIEIPRSARTEWRALYTEVLAQFLAETAQSLVRVPPAGGPAPPP